MTKQERERLEDLMVEVLDAWYEADQWREREQRMARSALSATTDGDLWPAIVRLS